VKDEVPNERRCVRNSVTAIKQILRMDILSNILMNLPYLDGKKLFKLIFKEGKNRNLVNVRIRNGWLFESICHLLIIFKCFCGIDYSELYDGELDQLKRVNNIRELIDKKIGDNVGNIVDITIQQHDSTFVFFSVKYQKKYGETDLVKIKKSVESRSHIQNFKLGLIVKDKEMYQFHKFRNAKNVDRQVLQEVIDNRLLFDEKDVIQAMELFVKKFDDFKNTHGTISNLIDHINEQHLSNPRIVLIKRFHQRFVECEFSNAYPDNYDWSSLSPPHIWCLSHKPRSGKSISLLLICKFLLERNIKKILLITSVPSTLITFYESLDNYDDFRHIRKYRQEDILSLKTEILDASPGICFCSVQFLKLDNRNEKKDFLKTIGFDVIIVDESHHGSSTEKTKEDILEMKDITESISQPKIILFASGTSRKTIAFYKIHPSRVLKWDLEDELCMKKLVENPSHEAVLKHMTARHGSHFFNVYRDNSVNKDYSQSPSQVLLRMKIPQTLINQINEYNALSSNHHRPNIGFHIPYLFALKKEKTKHKRGRKSDKIAKEDKDETTTGPMTYDFIDEFEICDTAAGTELLKGFLEFIISNDDNEEESIMKEIEKIQSEYHSRKSEQGSPLLFIVYLPTFTRMSVIEKLQMALYKFIQKNQLWKNYNVEYSNANSHSGDVYESFEYFIESIMRKTYNQRKRGCVLLLGNQGSIGVTYKDCDVTISLDDGQDIDNLKQKYYRALTETPGKTVGVNVDLNSNRVYHYVFDIVHTHQTNMEGNQTGGEILQYLYENKIFLFNPHLLRNCEMTSTEVALLYQRQLDELLEEAAKSSWTNGNVVSLLENIECKNFMSITDLFYNIAPVKKGKRQSGDIEFQNDIMVVAKGNPVKRKVILKKRSEHEKEEEEGEEEKDEDSNDEEIGNEEEKEMEDEYENAEDIGGYNRTLQFCKEFVVPLWCFLVRINKLDDFHQLFTEEKYYNQMKQQFNGKHIYMKDFSDIHDDKLVKNLQNMMNVNILILNQLKDIYVHANFNKLKELVLQSFTATETEIKHFSNFTTPQPLVDRMMNCISDEYWKEPKRVLDPCCGKGKFILATFDRLVNGLSISIPDKWKCCKFIIDYCIYFTDILELNVFITKELLRCCVAMHCGHEHHKNVLKLEFNCMKEDSYNRVVWGGIPKTFDLIVSNPPYSQNYNKKTVYHEFIQNYIEKCERMLFVTPSRWFTSGKGLTKFRESMVSRKDIEIMVHVDDCRDFFPEGVNIAGGVNFFLKNSDYKGPCNFNNNMYYLNTFGDFVIDPSCHQLFTIITEKRRALELPTLDMFYLSSCYFKIETNDERLQEEPGVGSVLCYVSQKHNTDRIKYIHDFELGESNRFWKVLTPHCHYYSGTAFGELFIGEPDAVFNHSYVCFRVENEQQGKNLISYLRTRFVERLMRVLKRGQDISKNCCKLIPVVPLTQSWDDEKVCNLFGIDLSLYV